MALWIQPGRVRAAIVALADWRQRAKSQGAKHLWPLLASIEKGASAKKFVQFSESDDFDFWDRYARVPGDIRPRTSDAGFADMFYVEPLALSSKPSDYPHRGPWTIRTRTFLNSWKAAEFRAADNSWKLVPKFAAVFENKVLLREGEPQRVPVVDLAAWLFRDREFPDSASAKSLEDIFLRTFPFTPPDYDTIFEFVDESLDAIFTATKPDDAQYRTAIEESLVRHDSSIATPPPLYGTTEEGAGSLTDDDVVLMQVHRLLALGTSGIVFRGCPGTSKTWYAKQIARRLVADASHIFQVQFHPSYGYEDFVEGYRQDNTTKSGFKIVDKLFLEACDMARRVSTPVILIADEINRGDPARILGELLTYIEYGYRGQPFRLPYTGKEASVPPNLLLIGTMNHHDKSVTQLDLALVRRFDHIDLTPSVETVEMFLERFGAFSRDQIDRVVEWFDALQRIVTSGVGHTYFKDVRTPDQLETVWRYRILPYCQSVLEFEPESLEHVKKSFDATYRAVIGQTPQGETK